MLTLEELQRQIQHIIDTVHPVPVDQVGIGCLTMEDRNNRRMLALVDSALLIVCLDGTTHKNNNERSQQLLHGGANGENLWYDKFQVISCPGGTLGINFEHSYADGIAWNRWLSETWYDMQDTANPDGWERLPRLTQV
ncbi:hypothetical protein T484DRAFT_1845659 [Baffinella frigidus]|nr:hypothetical protein T484DRAFT_1845659 [Cryptophyta sp. CCMP2293]